MAEDKNWTKMSYVGSICHQFGVAKKNCNYKYVKGQKEVVFNHKGNKIVNDERNKGTYNFCSPYKSSTGHFYADVLPWLAWGNSKSDSTTIEQRCDAFLMHVPKTLMYLNGRARLMRLVWAVRKL